MTQQSKQIALTFVAISSLVGAAVFALLAILPVKPVENEDAQQFARLMQDASDAWSGRSADDSLPVYLDAMRLAKNDQDRATCRFCLGQCYAKSGMIQLFTSPEQGMREMWQAAESFRISGNLAGESLTNEPLSHDPPATDSSTTDPSATENCARALLLMEYFAPSDQSDQQQQQNSGDTSSDEDMEPGDEEQESDDGDAEPQEAMEPEDTQKERDSATAHINPEDVLEKEQQNNRFRQRNREMSREAGERDW